MHFTDFPLAVLAELKVCLRGCYFDEEMGSSALMQNILKELEFTLSDALS